MKKRFCIIMAGGVGKHFWPLSREKRPKQFIDLLGTGKTLIQDTYDRMCQICPQENIFVVTINSFVEITQDQLPNLTSDRILIEPARRNTAPCIIYATEKIKSIEPDAQIIVTPSDHIIQNELRFEKVVNDGIEFVSQNNALLTIGLKPTRPETDYGYIQIEDSTCTDDIMKVKNFTEKPNLELATFFLESEEFLWNSGIFIWSLKTITQAFVKYLPELSELFEEYKSKINTTEESDAIQEIYAGCKNISIDYGIMEKADNVYVYCGNFGWSDLGTWSTLYDSLEKDENDNIKNNDDTLIYDTRNSFIKIPKGKIAAIKGLDGFIVADTPDALLICKKGEESKLRQILNDIKFNKGNDYI
jgi:mannose-1-phosphate guanylyltransferase